MCSSSLSLYCFYPNNIQHALLRKKMIISATSGVLLSSSMLADNTSALTLRPNVQNKMKRGIKKLFGHELNERHDPRTKTQLDTLK